MQLLSDLFGVHEAALRGRARQVELIAQNIANADTPHYKARDIDFKVLLAKAVDTSPAGTLGISNPAHLPAQAADVPPDALRYRVPFNSSPDGNTVETSVEQAAYGRAASNYSATLNFLHSQVSEVMRALKGE
jgi:flagellar basal-body rod protein FlgB